MKIETKEVTSGGYNGKKLWICDLRFNDFNDKPIRHIGPVEVLVCSNEETKKRIYYSDSHFVQLNKAGEPIKSKITPVFDNTGIDLEQEPQFKYLIMQMSVLLHTLSK